MSQKRKRSEAEGMDENNVKNSEKEDLMQLAMDKHGIHQIYIEENEHEEAVDNPSPIDPLALKNQAVQEQSTEFVRPPPKKRTKARSTEARLKLISLGCEWNMCAAVYKKMEWFLVHINEHLSAEIGPPSGDGYLCSWRECDATCSSKEELDRHVFFHAFHTKIKGFGAILFEEKTERCILESSGRNVIPDIPEAFQCMWESCAYRFSSAQHFYWHVRSHVLSTDPGQDSLFRCCWEGCETVVDLKLRLTDHTRSHTQEKMVGCPNCGGIFSNNTKFFDHCIRQIPLQSQEFKCSHCSRKFANERLLRDHVRHHINYFKCSECEMTCPNKSTLAVHVRYRHSNEKPHKCPQCNRGFKTLMDVNRHLSVHSDEPSYGCPVQDCEYKCRSVATVNRHIKRVHSGLAKHMYLCHMCSSKFTNGDMLTKHLVKVHTLQWPSGHTRFRYIQDEDGFYRLQTVRYESIESGENPNGEENGSEQEENVDSPASADPASAVDRVRHTSVSEEKFCSVGFENPDPHKILSLKYPNNVKLTEYQEIILPSEF